MSLHCTHAVSTSIQLKGEKNTLNAATAPAPPGTKPFAAPLHGGAAVPGPTAGSSWSPLPSPLPAALLRGGLKIETVLIRG